MNYEKIVRTSPREGSDLRNRSKKRSTIARKRARRAKYGS